MQEVGFTAVSSSALVIGRDALLQAWQGRDRTLDPLDALILVSVIHGNVDPITAGLLEQVEFGAMDQPPPGDKRRRISVSRVADSLDLRFETVRRRVKRLESLGLMDTRRSGVVVPESYFHTPANVQAVIGIDAIAAHACARLKAVGFFDVHPLPDPILTPEGHPYRAVARLFMTYALRLGSEMRVLAGDFLNLFILLELTHLNTLPLSDRRDGDVTGRDVPVVGDERKTPVSISALARAADLSFETTRRRLSRLTAAGVCKAVDNGYIVPEAVILEFARKLAVTNEMNLARLYRACAQIGAVEGWRRGVAGCAPPASASEAA